MRAAALLAGFALAVCASTASAATVYGLVLGFADGSLTTSDFKTIELKHSPFAAMIGYVEGRGLDDSSPGYSGVKGGAFYGGPVGLLIGAIRLDGRTLETADDDYLAFIGNDYANGSFRFNSLTAGYIDSRIFLDLSVPGITADLSAPWRSTSGGGFFSYEDDGGFPPPGGIWFGEANLTVTSAVWGLASAPDLSAAPEPSAWAAMLTGFAIAGRALRRRKHSATRSQA